MYLSAPGWDKLTLAKDIPTKFPDLLWELFNILQKNAESQRANASRDAVTHAGWHSSPPAPEFMVVFELGE